MNVKQYKHLLLVGVVSLFLAACSSTSSDDDAQGMGAGAGIGDASGVTTGTLGDGGVGGSDLDTYNPGGLETVFYFDFDKATLRPESRAALQQHAANLGTPQGGLSNHWTTSTQRDDSEPWPLRRCRRPRAPLHRS